MSQTDIVVVITARLSSERLPGKVLEELVPGRSALDIQVQRALQIGYPVIVSVPENEPALVDIARKIPGVSKVSPGHPTNVIKQVYDAAKSFNPKVIVRGLPDCPYFDYFATRERAKYLLEYNAAHATRSYHPYGKDPIYGADEPAYSWELVERMLESVDPFEMENFGSYVDRHRLELNILYTPPLALDLYNDDSIRFRLELDTPEDLKMLRLLIEKTGIRATPRQAVWVLQRHPDWVRINSNIHEKTGPTVSYVDYLGEHKESLAWAIPLGDCRFGLAKRFKPIFCLSGKDFLGYVDPKDPGVLVTHGGMRVTGGRINCTCGAGRTWYPGRRNI